MKNANFSNLMKLTLALLLGIVFIASSCKKDNTTAPPVVVLDGTYVKGAVTAYPDFDAKAMMKVTKNEVTGTDRASLLELYIPIKAGAEGFNIVTVAGSVTTVYGPGTGFGDVTKGTTDEPQLTFQRGAVSATSTAKFTVPKDGMYHVAIDLALLKAVIVPVHWGVIGAATPKGWNGSTQLKESAFNLTSMSWDTTNLTLLKGEWKFRYSSGWKVELDTTIDVGGGKKGVKVNANFGGTTAALLPGGANIPNDAPGIYTMKFAYTLGSGYVATLTKTGDLPTIDYTNFEMGIIGNAYKLNATDTASWNTNYGTHKPVVAGKIFTWTYTLDLIAGREFKFRQGDDWAGKSIGYGACTWAGAAASNFSDNGGNIKVAAAGNFTLVLKIDATTEVYTVTCTKN